MSKVAWYSRPASNCARVQARQYAQRRLNEKNSAPPWYRLSTMRWHSSALKACVETSRPHDDAAETSRYVRPSSSGAGGGDAAGASTTGGGGIGGERGGGGGDGDGGGGHRTTGGSGGGEGGDLAATTASGDGDAAGAGATGCGSCRCRRSQRRSCACKLASDGGGWGGDGGLSATGDGPLWRQRRPLHGGSAGAGDESLAFGAASAGLGDGACLQWRLCRQVLTGGSGVG